MLLAKLFLQDDDVLWTYLLGGWMFCMSGTCLVALLPAGDGQHLDQQSGVVGGRASDRLIGALWFVISSIIFAVFSVVIRYDTTKVLSDESAEENPENPQAGTTNRCRRSYAGWYNHRGWGFAFLFRHRQYNGGINIPLPGAQQQRQVSNTTPQPFLTGCIRISCGPVTIFLIL